MSLIQTAEHFVLEKTEKIQTIFQNFYFRKGKQKILIWFLFSCWNHKFILLLHWIIYVFSFSTHLSLFVRYSTNSMMHTSTHANEWTRHLIYTGLCFNVYICCQYTGRCRVCVYVYSQLIACRVIDSLLFVCYSYPSLSVAQPHPNVLFALTFRQMAASHASHNLLSCRSTRSFRQMYSVWLQPFARYYVVNEILRRF